MTLGEMKEIIDIPFTVYDVNGDIVRGCTERDGIPAFMEDVRITLLSKDYEGRLEFYTDYHDDTKAIEYIKEQADTIYEKLADSYQCDSYFAARQTIHKELRTLEAKIETILNNMEACSDWNDNLDKLFD